MTQRVVDRHHERRLLRPGVVGDGVGRVGEPDHPAVVVDHLHRRVDVGLAAVGLAAQRAERDDPRTFFD